MITSIYSQEYRYIQVLILGYNSRYYKYVVPELEKEIVCERQYHNIQTCLTECQLKINCYLKVNPQINLRGFYYKGKKVLIHDSISGRGQRFEVVGYDHIFDSSDDFRSEASVRRAAEMAIDAYESENEASKADELISELKSRLDSANQKLGKITLKTDVKDAIEELRKKALARQKKAEVFSISKTFTKEEFLMMAESVLNVSFPASRLPFIVLAKCDYTQILSEHPEGFVQRLMRLNLTDLDFLTEVLRKYWMYNVFLTFEERLKSLGLHWDE